jgi:hypothetical protein
MRLLFFPFHKGLRVAQCDGKGVPKWRSHLAFERGVTASQGGCLAEFSARNRLSILRRRLGTLPHLHSAIGLTNPTQHGAVRRSLRGLAHLEVIGIEFRKSTGDARVLLRRTNTNPSGRVVWPSPETWRTLKT